MQTIYRGAALVAGCLSLTACATVTRGANTDWHVATNPSGATVQTSNGLSCSPTPCTMHIFRKSSFTATITKPGYKPVTVDVSHGFSVGGGVAFLGNAMIGGVIGAAVDLSTGATDDLSPRRVDISLEQQAAGAQLAYASPLEPYRPDAYRSSSYQAAEAVLPPQGGPTVDSRIVYLKVLPDRTVQEVREPGPGGQ